jgi:hypothetical protein
MPIFQGTCESVELQHQQRRRLTPCLQALDPAREPPLGAHILTPRRGYTHHGIYVGRGRVVHYGGLSRGLHRGPVEEVPLSQFARGRPIWIRPGDATAVSPEEVVRRACLRIGENRYRILTNNCEHFCEWCVSGAPRSYQVEALSGICQRMCRRLVLLARRGCFLRLPWPRHARFEPG